MTDGSIDNTKLQNLRLTPKRIGWLKNIAKNPLFNRYKNKRGELVFAKLIDFFLENAVFNPEIYFQNQFEKQSLMDLIEENYTALNKKDEILVELLKTLFNRIDQLEQKIDDMNNKNNNNNNSENENDKENVFANNELIKKPTPNIFKNKENGD